MGKPRNEDPDGGVYHLYARGNDQCVIYRDDADRELYVLLLRLVGEKAGWKVLSYCLMDNHVHLVVETPEGNLGWGMQWLHSRYVTAFNRRHGRSGHLFQGRYGSTVIEDDGHLYMALRYVAMNPVSAGMCRRPQDWEWSSCAATLSDDGSSCVSMERVLASFDWLGGDPRNRYAEMVEADGTAVPAGAGGAAEAVGAADGPPDGGSSGDRPGNLNGSHARKTKKRARRGKRQGKGKRNPP